MCTNGSELGGRAWPASAATKSSRPTAPPKQHALALAGCPRADPSDLLSRAPLDVERAGMMRSACPLVLPSTGLTPSRLSLETCRPDRRQV